MRTQQVRAGRAGKPGSCGVQLIVPQPDGSTILVTQSYLEAERLRDQLSAALAVIAGEARTRQEALTLD